MKSVNKYKTGSKKAAKSIGFAFTTFPILGVCLLFIMLEVVARTSDLLLYMKKSLQSPCFWSIKSSSFKSNYETVSVQVRDVHRSEFVLKDVSEFRSIILYWLSDTGQYPTLILTSSTKITIWKKSNSRFLSNSVTCLTYEKWLQNHQETILAKKDPRLFVDIAIIILQWSFIYGKIALKGLRGYLMYFLAAFRTIELFGF